MGENLYETLELNEHASQEDIKKSYRKLSLLFHPDRNNNSQESTHKFQKINAAYDVIGDIEKRKQYDMQQKMPKFGNGGHGHMFFNSESMGANSDDIMNFFQNNLFGRGGTFTVNGVNVGQNMFNMDNLKQRLSKPPPIIKHLTITLSKSYSGFNMPIEITRWINDNNTKREETETLYVEIPKGIDNNEIIIIRDKGNILSDNNKGDIKIFIKIDNDTDFVRNGLDLLLHKKINLKHALCGFEFDMNYVDGRVFKINNNSGNIITHNYNKVLKGMGMIRDGHSGNLIINFNILFPDTLAQEQIEKLKEIL